MSRSKDPYYAWKKRRDFAIARGTWNPSTTVEGTRRRIQALAAIGWSLRAQADISGLNRSTLTDISTGRVSLVKTPTADVVRRLYDRLWDVRPPRSNRGESMSVTRTLREAGARGWLPPLAWDDDLIDLPDADLAAELARQVSRMDVTELHRCYRAHNEWGDRSPLIVAGAEAYPRRRREARRVHAAA